MHIASAASPKDQRMMRQRRKKKDAPILAELADRLAEMRVQLREIEAEMEENEHKALVEKIASKEISIATVTGGWKERELTDIIEGRAKKVVREKIVPKALQRIAASLDSEDERCALVAAKMACDIGIEPTDEDKRPQYVRMDKLRDITIDVGEDV